MKWRINILCLIGAIIGILSIFLSWQDHYYLNAQNGWEWEFTHSENLFESHTSIIIGLFLIGTIGALITPLGFIFQFLALSALWFSSIATIPEARISEGIGYWIAHLSFLLIFISLIRPIGPGLMSSQIPFNQRLLTISQ